MFFRPEQPKRHNMKNLLLLSTLTLSLMFSAGSWAEWTAVIESADGSRDYVDFDSIRKVNGLVYYWEITDNLEPDEWAIMSHKRYYKADCETTRTMQLSVSTYKLPMAEGNAYDTWTPDPEWKYAQPDSVLEATLLAVCAH